ncbi:LppU/SCO3897 family protein [Nonomuraea sediminis]|uniref:LppU/SCO3897 family protein n=1 Tax=Nonomuraea sediminis TaxID=2835864 RepID=UPI001BDBE508|nr:hypothetical protein [Nonomuraea sediminis]
MPRLSFVAILLLALSFLTGCSKDDPANAQPGNCLEALGQDPKTTGFHIVDCGAPNAAYKVALRLGRFDSCQTNTYGYATSGGSRRSGWHLCLTLNAKVGDCFHQEVGFPTGKAVKVPCGAGATYRVVKSVPGTADKALCGEDAVDPVRNDLARPIALVYPQPPLTICTDRA